MGRLELSSRGQPYRGRGLFSERAMSRRLSDLHDGTAGVVRGRVSHQDQLANRFPARFCIIGEEAHPLFSHSTRSLPKRETHHRRNRFTERKTSHVFSDHPKAAKTDIFMAGKKVYDIKAARAALVPFEGDADAGGTKAAVDYIPKTAQGASGGRGGGGREWNLGASAAGFPEDPNGDRPKRKRSEDAIIIDFLRRRTPPSEIIAEAGLTKGSIAKDDSLRLKPYQFAEYEAAVTKFFALVNAIGKQFPEVDYHTIEDSVAEAYLIAEEKWENFKDDGGATRVTWIRGIATNVLRAEVATDRIRSRQKRRVVTITDPEIITDAYTNAIASEAGPEEIAFHRVNPLDSKLRGIPHKGLLLALANEMTAAEIAAELGEGRHTVEKNIATAIDHLFAKAGILPGDSPDMQYDKVAAFLAIREKSASPNQKEDNDAHLRWTAEVSVEAQKAARLVGDMRDGLGILGIQMADALGIDITDYYKFEKGEKYIDLGLVYDAAVKCGIDRRDHRMVAFEEIRSDMDWFRTLTLSDVPLSRGVNLFVVANGQSVKDFEKGISLSVTPIIKGKRLPEPESINTILAAAPIDSDGKAAQFERMQSERMTPYTVDAFMKLPRGQRLRYIRVLTGRSVKQLARELRSTPAIVRAYEADTKKRRDKYLDVFADWLKLPEGDPLRTALKETSQEIEFTEEEEITILSKRFLFQEHIDQLQPYVMSPREEKLDELITGMFASGNTVNNVLRTLIEKSIEGKQKDLFPEVQLSGDARRITSVYEDNSIPQDLILFTFLQELCGYTVHNPTARRVLDRAEYERQRKKNNRIQSVLQE